MYCFKPSGGVSGGGASSVLSNLEPCWSTSDKKRANSLPSALLPEFAGHLCALSFQEFWQRILAENFGRVKKKYVSLHNDQWSFGLPSVLNNAR